MARNLSETIIAFAAPLLGALPHDPGSERIRHALSIAIAAWNAVTLDSWHTSTDETDSTRRSLEATAEPERAAVLAVFDALLERKRTDFAEDLRAVGKWEVVASPEGGFDLSADGYLPNELVRVAKA